MQLHTAIDDKLWSQALQVTGLTTPTEVLELALQRLLQTSTSNKFDNHKAGEHNKPLDLDIELLKAEKARFAKQLPPSVIEPIDTPSVYHGKPLTLEEMQWAIEAEAGYHK